MHDGDTVTIRGTKVRLACIDAPEYGQTRGEDAKLALQRLIGNRIPQVTRLATDRHGRTVAILTLDKRNLNVEMVRQGQAFVYRQYLASCPALVRNQLVQAEEEARKKKIGVWQDNPPEYPWKFRRAK